LRQWEEAFISALTTLQQAILNHIPPKLRDALILEMKQAGDKYNVIKRLGFRSSIVGYYNKSPFYQDPHGLMQLLVKRFDLKDNIRLRNAVTMFETLVFNKDEDPRLMYSEFRRALLHVTNVLPKHTLCEEYICASFIRRLPQSIYARVISEIDRENKELLTVDVMLHKLAAEYEYNKQNNHMAEWGTKYEKNAIYSEEDIYDNEGEDYIGDENVEKGSLIYSEERK
jgi:hypothetical protein